MTPTPARRLPFAVAVLASFALAIPSAAGASPLPSSPFPLPGSTFQGGDGNQDDAPPSIDWQGMQAAGRVAHSPDPNAQDTAFAGGTKEDAPGAWDLTTEPGGVNPGKANILDAWSTVDQPGSRTFLYLAFTRAEANGTTYVAFELNQDARTWDNGHATIPCRRTGDVLVVLAAHGDGVEVILQRWTTSGTDPGTGCATTGSLATVATVPVGSAQGAVNSGSIANFLPGADGTTIAEPARFGEAALDIAALLDTAFRDDCLVFGSIWMHSRSSLSESSQMQDYVAPRALSLRTCAAAGTKFLDANADGERDADEPGLPRFLIWADYDGDGIRGAGEPFTVSDAHGHYVLQDIRPPAGTYTLRETLLDARRAATTSWVCSFPNAATPGGFGDGPGGQFGCGWGPITAAQTPFAQDRDFGNWLPARLTVEKQLWPADDPGRFDLRVNGTTVVPAAGDGASTTISVPPGGYDITETAVPPTDPGAYRSTVACRGTTRRRSTLRGGPAYNGLVLRAGDQATCTFTNVRLATPTPVPAIAIEKSGPSLATAGDTLKYTFAVTNPGDVPLPAATVKVTDPACDAPPELTGKGGDASPGTLDPGDTWSYACSRSTTHPGSDCTASVIRNTATASGTAGGTTVEDSSSIVTGLICPDQPPISPIPPDPPPDPPVTPHPVPPANGNEAESLLPPGLAPPVAGRAGVAGLRVAGRCLARISQVQVTGTHISHIRVTADGRLVRAATLRILQRRATVLSHLLGAGRHRIAVRVAFERGSGTPPVTLRRTVRICAPPRPSFTG